MPSEQLEWQLKNCRRKSAKKCQPCCNRNGFLTGRIKESERTWWVDDMPHDMGPTKRCFCADYSIELRLQKLTPGEGYSKTISIEWNLAWINKKCYRVRWLESLYFVVVRAITCSWNQLSPRMNPSSQRGIRVAFHNSHPASQMWTWKRLAVHQVGENEMLKSPNDLFVSRLMNDTSLPIS